MAHRAMEFNWSAFRKISGFHEKFCRITPWPPPAAEPAHLFVRFSRSGNRGNARPAPADNFSRLNDHFSARFRRLE